METVSDYKKGLAQHLMKICRSKALLGGELLQTPDLDDKWQSMAPEFLADAVPEFNGYPEVVLAWAAYLGTAVAWCWDTDWMQYSSKDYKFFCGEKGFDYMDEHITEHLLGMPLGSKEAETLASRMRSLADEAYSYLMHAGLEAGSTAAFQAVLATIDTLFTLAASIGLHTLGYKLQPL